MEDRGEESRLHPGQDQGEGLGFWKAAARIREGLDGISGKRNHKFGGHQGSKASPVPLSNFRPVQGYQVFTDGRSSSPVPGIKVQSRSALD